MTKQETIAKAWGDYFKELKHFINDDGWFDKNSFYNNEFSFKIYENINIDFIHKEDFMRPKSLAGIENNNGWIKIESEEDLPKDDEFKFNETFLVYYCCKGCSNMIFKGSIDKYTLKFRDITNKLEKEKVTHYQPIVKPESPIY